MMEKIVNITLSLVAIVALPIGIYFLIKSVLRKRSSLSLLEIIVVILLAVILWFTAIGALRSNPNDFFDILIISIFRFFLIGLPILIYYNIIKNRCEDNLPNNHHPSNLGINDPRKWRLQGFPKISSKDFFGLFLFFFLITFPSFIAFKDFPEPAKRATKLDFEFNEPFKVWHALYLFIIAWYIKHHFYTENEERTIKIAPQNWCRKNLDVSTYRNGDAIPEVQDASTWSNLTTGAWCYYENESANGTTYGKLYNWYAVNDPRGLAPKGYYIPSGDDSALTNSIMGRANFKGEQMKSTSGWENNGNGNNSSGFAGLPGGFRDGTGVFKGIGTVGYWWSSGASMSYSLFANNGNVHLGFDKMTIGFSVRCLKD